jgi:chitinase
MISYDDAQTFSAKGKFIRNQGLLGFSMWEVAGDHNNLLVNAIRSGGGY